jgi:hypothetical protein
LMIGIAGMVTNIHKFVKHKWTKQIPKKWKNLGTWRYVATFKYCYPNIPEILTAEYGLKWEDKIIVYITKEITTPKFRRYRTKFKKVFCGELRGYKTYLREFLRKKGYILAIKKMEGKY